jgi:hypothetical protein
MSDHDIIPTQITYVSEKETMLKSQYELLLEQNPYITDNTFEMFKKTWDICESYMMNVLKYALMNKDELTNKIESDN